MPQYHTDLRVKVSWVVPDCKFVTCLLIESPCGEIARGNIVVTLHISNLNVHSTEDINIFNYTCFF